MTAAELAAVVGFLRDEADRADDAGRLGSRDRLEKLADLLDAVGVRCLLEDYDSVARRLAEGVKL